MQREWTDVAERLPKTDEWVMTKFVRDDDAAFFDETSNILRPAERGGWLWTGLEGERLAAWRPMTPEEWDRRFALWRKVRHKNGLKHGRKRAIREEEERLAREAAQKAEKQNV